MIECPFNPAYLFALASAAIAWLMLGANAPFRESERDFK